MDLTRLINHPELMNKETLYELRSLTALYPYYQTARFLMLQNLYLLHDTSFDEELRRAAVYLTDRKVLFELVEAAHYKIEGKPEPDEAAATNDDDSSDRTSALIDTFLDSIPKEKEENEDTGEEKEEKKTVRRKPTPADATVDYIKYMMESESDQKQTPQDKAVPKMIGQTLIDDYLTGGGKITLQENPENLPQIDEQSSDKKDMDEGYFTETLAKIYIKQGKYTKALEIIQRLNLNYPKKNAYFADQIRFLKKLILNNNNNK